MRKSLLYSLFFFLYLPSFAQSLQPGFNGHEYTDMLAMNFQRFDSLKILPAIPIPANYHVVYRSPEVGMQNRWNMWYRNDEKLAVISLRGTINQQVSWLENFYAAMIPATGSLQINDSTTFNYQLAADSKANVHVGWVLGLAHLAPTIVEQIKIAYAKGIREIIIIGHSQGGALATLTRSYLFYLTEKGELPKDIVYKSYCSASPKVGNLYFAYDFDFITRNGWAFTIVNAADWVPETLFSVQTLTDFNPLNPFLFVDGIIKKQSFLKRLYIKRKYNKMKNGVRTAQERFESNLGGLVYKLFIKKVFPQLKEPVYAHDNNYQRVGVPIVLQPDAEYYKVYPNEGTNVFVHHMFAPYYLLAKKYYTE
ncbi:MAG: lipase family protein [Chitinophagaceae bacterium]